MPRSPGLSFILFRLRRCSARRIAGCRLARGRCSRCLALLIVGAFLLVWTRYRAISFGLFAMPLAFLLVVFPAIGLERYTFASPTVRNGWIIVHVCALLAAYAALIFSLLASLLYLIQEKRLKDRQQPIVPGLAAATGDDEPDRATRPGDRLPLHDAGTADRFADRPGERGARRIFSIRK